MAGPAGTNWSGANHSGQHDDPMPGVHETSEMGGPISRSARPKDLTSPEDFARTKTIAWCAIVAVAFALMTLLSYRTARWLEATDNGMGAEKMRELVSGFLGATIIVAIMVAIDPHGEIFIG